MRIIKSAIYDQFRCIASQCPDSCCKEWSVSVDPETAALYRKLPGDLGNRLRQVLHYEDGDIIMQIEAGRCPMWRQDGLCRIQAELNHDALCHTCREFPRLTHDYGTFQEWGLELSCPEAARLILSSPALPPVSFEIPGGDEPEYEPEDMELLLHSRATLLQLLTVKRPVNHRLVLALMYGYHVQSQLDGGDVLPFDPDAALSEAHELANPGNSAEILHFYENLELLSDSWGQRLRNPQDSTWQEEHITLMRYFIERYWLQAVSDFDLVGRVKFAVISCLVIKLLGGNLLQTAQRYSKEIENDPDNVDAILDGAYTCPAFTDDKLLGLLLERTGR